MASKKQELLDAAYLANHLRISPILLDGLGESPDIIWNLNGMEIGLEVTSGASHDYHRLMHLSEKGEAPYLMNIGNLTDAKIRRSNKELINLSQSINYVATDNKNRLWINRMISKIQRKTSKLNREDYRILDQNWLLIFDREATLNYEVNVYCENFNYESIFNHSEINFNKIFVVGYPYILTYCHEIWLGDIFKNDYLADSLSGVNLR